MSQVALLKGGDQHIKDDEKKGLSSENEAAAAAQYPRVEIEYCNKCKWLLRAAWIATELLSTFAEDLKGGVNVKPSPVGGTYRITVQVDGQTAHVIWDRVNDHGFPQPKEIKRKLRSIAFPEQALGRCLESK